jgi:hypothetical protein
VLSMPQGSNPWSHDSAQHSRANAWPIRHHVVVLFFFPPRLFLLQYLSQLRAKPRATKRGPCMIGPE